MDRLWKDFFNPEENTIAWGPVNGQALPTPLPYPLDPQGPVYREGMADRALIAIRGNYPHVGDFFQGQRKRPQPLGFYPVIIGNQDPVGA